jgi:hypothetical protein
MRRERILKLKLDQALESFSGRKWKLFQLLDLEHGRLLKLEVPVSEGESYVVELVYSDGHFLEEALVALRAAGWIEQETRTVP